MIVLRRSGIFDAWLRKLRSDVAVAQINNRLTAAKAGNFGDCKIIGEGVLEMRIHHGPGYRVYFMREGKPSISCCVVATNPVSTAISSGLWQWQKKSGVDDGKTQNHILEV